MSYRQASLVSCVAKLLAPLIVQGFVQSPRAETAISEDTLRYKRIYLLEPV